MPEAGLTRLTISWSKDTDLALRSHLGAQGLKKGALSKFVEDAVKWRLLDQSVGHVRDAFAGISSNELQSVIDEAVTSIRKEKRQQRKRRSEK
ncbi:MAG TPA: ribbon-helix-helix domain-containing protein [Candidatus Solibacter sp.]|nr:ribbon-helix-helix domain-containing protein [Candidatus Solibacter sp.]